MPLFTPVVDPAVNCLPYEGTVNDYGVIFSPTDAAHYFTVLHETLAWQQDQALIYGHLITTMRKVAWYADAAYPYTYSRITRYALPWTEALLELKNRIEQLTQSVFNSCSINLYDDGNTGMAWHSDDEKELGENTIIASLSLGAVRRFAFKHKRTDHRVTLSLESGHLIVMKDETQRHWQHCVHKTKKITSPRINLTFRTIATV